MPVRSNIDDVTALREIAREFTEGFNTGDVDRIMRYYGDRYVDVNLRRPEQSKQERREYYRHVMSNGIRVQVHPDDILVDGAWAFVRGHIDVMRTEADRPVELRYMEIARKQADGSWQMVWGMDGPVQEYESRVEDSSSNINSSR
jgi:ketosteroid isomerase-like protein